MTADAYAARVRACWLGKAAGGTLGQPYEGLDGPHALTFYDPVPAGVVPNDDLDLQVIAAVALARQAAPVVDADVIAHAWLSQVHFPWSEYGVALRNLRAGLRPPDSGAFDNWYQGGMGAAIRSELWACLAPGDPERAAAYAEVDASIDHAGEGVWAARFLAALQSAAFTPASTSDLLAAALRQIPDHSHVARAVRLVQASHASGETWLSTRTAVLSAHGHEEFTWAPMNVGLTIAGWLHGEGDFARSVCLAANGGKDADCTAATVGALCGILAPDSLPAAWLAPLGDALVLNAEVVVPDPPRTLTAFTELVIALRQRLAASGPVRRPRDGVCSPPVPVQRAFVDYTRERLLDSLFMPPPHWPAPVMPASAEWVDLPGTWATLDTADFRAPAVLLRYRVRLADARKVRVMVNTPQNCRVWIAGRFAFGRESGRMAPSPHCAPLNQYADVVLDAGVHDVHVVIARPSAGAARAEWVVAIAEVPSFQWVQAPFVGAEA